MAGAGRQRRGDRAAAGDRAHHGQPRPGPARAGRGPEASPSGRGRTRCSPARNTDLSRRQRRSRKPGRGLSLVLACRRLAAGRRSGVRFRRRACPGRGMRGRCCCTRSAAGAAEILASAAGRDGRAGDAALLSAVSMCFALGAATIEQFKHLAAAEAGPARRARRAARAAGAAAGAGRDRRRGRPAEDPVDVRVRDAGRRPGDLRRLLRR